MAILVLGHFSTRSFWSLVILGPRSFLSLVIWPGLFRFGVISVPGHFSPGTFWDLVFWPWINLVHGRFVPLEILVLLFWSQVILTPGHFGPPSPGTFLSQIISVPGYFGLGHFGPWSFNLSPGSFQSQAILFQGRFGLGSLQSLVISAIGLLVNSFTVHFCSGSFRTLVILNPGPLCP